MRDEDKALQYLLDQIVIENAAKSTEDLKKTVVKIAVVRPVPSSTSDSHTSTCQTVFSTDKNHHLQMQIISMCSGVMVDIQDPYPSPNRNCNPSTDQKEVVVITCDHIMTNAQYNREEKHIVKHNDNCMFLVGNEFMWQYLTIPIFKGNNCSK